MQKLAHVVLKRDEFSSTVPRKYVTPAELMFLVADSRDAAKGEPIVSITLVPDNAEEADLNRLEKELIVLQEKREKFSLTDEITEEVRTERVNALDYLIKNRLERINDFKGLQGLRGLEPDQEVRRLARRYRQDKIANMFPGSNPVLPATHEDAIRRGKVVAIGGGRFMFQDSGGHEVPVLT